MEPKVTLASFLRIASVAIAAYDYLRTLPVEWKFYKYKGSHDFATKLNTALFILIRYISIIVLIISNVGFFYEGFTETQCKRYYMLAPAFKVTQIFISQVILGIRTFNISRRSRSIGYFLIVFNLVVIALQAWTDIWNRVPVSVDGNCTSGNNNATQLTNWLFYAIAMVYDIVTLGMSTMFLVMAAPSMDKMSDVLRMMLYDGLGYFVVLTGANICNLIIYRASKDSVQSSGASFGYTIIWIMSQRLLIHTREASVKRAHQAIIVTHELSTARDVTDAMRSQFATKDGDSLGRATELDVQVQIERAVTFDYNPTYEFRRESYRKPKVEGSRAKRVNWK